METRLLASALDRWDVIIIVAVALAGYLVGVRWVRQFFSSEPRPWKNVAGAAAMGFICTALIGSVLDKIAWVAFLLYGLWFVVEMMRARRRKCGVQPTNMPAGK